MSLIPFDQAPTGTDYGYTGNSLADTIGSMDRPNRITTKGSQFHMVVDGSEIQATHGPLQVVIVGFSDFVSRDYYDTAYDPKAESKGPSCYSEDGVTPSVNATGRQSQSCALCPMNIKGSGNNGTKACRTFKRVVVVLAGDASQTPYQMDLASMSLFGDDYPAQNQYNLKNYAALIGKRGLPVAAVVATLSFDSKASVPKLLFSPTHVIDAQLYQARMAAVDVEKVKDYVQIEIKKPTTKPQLTQGYAPQAQLGAPAPVAAAPVPVAVPVAAAPVAAPVAAPTPMAAAPVAAPTPVAVAPVAAAPVAAAGLGLGLAAPAATAPAAQTSGVVMSMDELAASMGMSL